MRLSDRAVFMAGAVLVVGLGVSVIGLLGLIFGQGLSAIDWKFLLVPVEDSGRGGGVLDPLGSTLWIVTLALLLAAPVGTAAGLYLAEYQRATLWGGILRTSIGCLAGIPSVVFGLFGLALFSTRLGLGWSVLSGALTLSVMMLPTLILSSEMAVRAVPESYREGSLALGATRWVTTARVVLPPALPGIFTGLILSLGRAVGETAALVLTAGTAPGFPSGLLDPGRTLSVHLYLLASEGVSLERAYGSAVILVLAAGAFNSILWALRHRYGGAADGKDQSPGQRP